MIGGGEIGRPDYPVETTKLDKEIIRLTNKSHPKLLFLPTASSDSEGYVEVVKKHFGNRLVINKTFLNILLNCYTKIYKLSILRYTHGRSRNIKNIK